VRRHELDPVSILAGLVFLLVAGGYALGHATDIQVRWLFAVPAALLAAGAALVAYVIRGIGRTPTRDTTDQAD
jgi:ABC-type sulfate transport system permease subunit